MNVPVANSPIISIPVSPPTRATRAQLAASADEFAAIASAAIAAAVGNGAPASLLALKLDPNGGPSGVVRENGNSAALREQVVELIRRNLRTGDVVSHGSDEVLILLQGASRQQGSQIAGNKDRRAASTA